MMNKITKPETQDIIWTMKDVLLVVLFIFAVEILFYVFTLVLFGDSKTTFNVVRYVGSLLMIFIPLYWVKKKFGLSKEVLGLKKGRFSLPSYVLIGTVAAIIYFFLSQITLFRYATNSTGFKFTYSAFHLILLPLSIGGFASIVLTPIGEEILIRGFVYGYFRQKKGVIIGLFLQALLFSLLHYNIYENYFNALAQTFIIGVILGCLYEKMGSLYPSMICHGMINYLSIIAFVLNK
jgi:membrane protease YdiL (CAAX protease family)